MSELFQYLMNGDCLEIMKQIPDNYVDMVMCDLPYGTTQNKWDSLLSLDQLWNAYNRVCKGAIILTAAQPFTSLLVVSNLDQFKYEWIWNKSRAVGHLNAKKMPLREHESILVFKSPLCYNPQLLDKVNPRSAQRSVKSKGSYGEITEGKFRSIPVEKGYPRSVLFMNDAYHDREAGLHPTQKPVALMEYLIKTYTNEGMIILDNCMGSGTTGVACVNTNRSFIGIEQDENYFKIAQQRIAEARATESPTDR